VYSHDHIGRFQDENQDRMKDDMSSPSVAFTSWRFLSSTMSRPTPDRGIVNYARSRLANCTMIPYKSGFGEVETTSVTGGMHSPIMMHDGGPGQGHRRCPSARLGLVFQLLQSRRKRCGMQLLKWPIHSIQRLGGTAFGLPSWSPTH
jgi:hypothetical protein